VSRFHVDGERSRWPWQCACRDKAGQNKWLGDPVDVRARLVLARLGNVSVGEGCESVIRVGSGNPCSLYVALANENFCHVAEILQLPVIYTSHLPTLRGNRIDSDAPSSKFLSILIYGQASAYFSNENTHTDTYERIFV